MGFRFQKRISLFPGVRLNFSARGISTTIGVRGASVNVGARGSYLNLGIPGSGLSYRTRISAPHTTSNGGFVPRETAEDFQPKVTSAAVEGAIQSANVSQLTSEGLTELKKLINEAVVRRRELAEDLSTAKAALRSKERRERIAKFFLVRLFAWTLIPKLEEKTANARITASQAQAQFDACAINVDFGLDEQTEAAFAALHRSFEDLRRCHAIWDMTSSIAANQFVERTIAKNSVTRQSVRLDFAESEVLRAKQAPLHFENANGSDLYVYPAFVMAKSLDRDFALIQFRDANCDFNPTRFIEEEQVPSDAEVVGRTWKKANKDGSPDRRFRDNYEIPIVRYGEIWFSGPNGLREAYLFSNSKAAESFAFSLQTYAGKVAELAKRPAIAKGDENSVEVDEALGDQNREPNYEAPSSARPRVFLDLVVLLVVLPSICAGLYLNWDRLSSNISWTRSPPATAAQAAPPVPSAKPSVPSALGQPRPQAAAKVDPPKQLAPLSLAPVVNRPIEQNTRAPEYLYVQRSNINVRAAPSLEGSIVRSLSRGTRVQTFRRQGEWIEVGDKQPIGWSLGTLLGAVAPSN